MARGVPSRGIVLLTSHLSKSQLREYHEDGGFTVRAPSGNVWFLARGSREWCLFLMKGTICSRQGINYVAPIVACAAISGKYPASDHLLALKLFLETTGGEAQFLQVANVASFYPARPHAAGTINYFIGWRKGRG